MLRFIVRDCYVGSVIHANGQPEITHKTFDGDLKGLEDYLRFQDQEGQRSEFRSRELVGVELIPEGQK